MTDNSEEIERRTEEARRRMADPARMCPFGCERRMSTDRREGESDVDWFDRDPSKDYHPRSCLGPTASRKAWSIRLYGVPDITTAERLNGTMKVTVEFEIDASCYNQALAMRELREEIKRSPKNGMPIGVSGGALNWRMTKAKVKGIKFERKP